MFDCNLAAYCHRKLKQHESLQLIQFLVIELCYRDCSTKNSLQAAIEPLKITVEFRGQTSLLFSSEITFDPITKYTEKPPSWDRDR